MTRVTQIPDDSSVCGVEQGEDCRLDVGGQRRPGGVQAGEIGVRDGLGTIVGTTGFTRRRKWRGSFTPVMRQAAAWYRSLRCREIATDAELDNEAAQRLHRYMGFAETYRIVEFRKQL